MKGIQIQGAYLCSKKVTDFEKRKYFSSTSSTKSGEQPLLECPLTTQGGFKGVWKATDQNEGQRGPEKVPQQSHGSKDMEEGNGRDLRTMRQPVYGWVREGLTSAEDKEAPF